MSHKLSFSVPSPLINSRNHGVCPDQGLVSDLVRPNCAIQARLTSKTGSSPIAHVGFVSSQTIFKVVI